MRLNWRSHGSKHYGAICWLVYTRNVERESMTYVVYSRRTRMPILTIEVF